MNEHSIFNRTLRRGGAILRGDFKNQLKGLGLRAFAKNVGMMSGGTLAGQIVTIVVVPFLTRLYGPHSYGIYAAFVSAVGILTILSGSYLNVAVISAYSKRVALALLQAVTLFTVVLSASLSGLAYIIIHLFHHPIMGEVDAYLPWLVLVLPAASSQVLFAGWSTRIKAFHVLSLATVIGAILGDIFQILGGIAHLGALGLILGVALGQYFAAAWQGWSAFRIILRSRFPSYRAMRRALTGNRQFVFWDLVTNLLSAASLQVVPIAVAFIYGPTKAGLFFLAYRIVMLPVNLVTRALRGVTQAEMTRLRAKNADRIRALFLAVTVATILLTSPILLVVPFGRDLFALIFGRAWGDAGALSAIIVFSAWTCGFSTVIECLPILGYNHWYTYPLATRLGLTVVVIWAAATLKLPLTTFTIAITVAWSATYLFTYVLNYLAIRRVEKGEWGFLRAV